MVLSYFFHQPANQRASCFAAVGIGDAAQQPPLKKKVLLYRKSRTCLFWGGAKALRHWGMFRFLSLGNDAALTPHKRFHEWELQGESSFRNLHMFYADLFFLLAKKKKKERNAGIPEKKRNAGVPKTGRWHPHPAKSPTVLCESPFDIPALPYKAPLWALQLCAQLSPI